MKACIRCGDVKPLGEFYRHGEHRDGRRSECRRCTYERNRVWRAENKQRRNETDRQARQRLVDEAHEHLGGECSRCGIDDPRVLQVDHVNDDGAVERRSMRRDDIWKRVLADTSGRYQLLCANCHAIKTYATRMGN